MFATNIQKHFFTLHYITILFIILSVTTAKDHKECIPLEGLAPGYIACVCNATYCDNIEDYGKLKPDEFAVYESNEDGKRLQLTVGKIGEKLKFQTKQDSQKIVIKIDPSTTHQNVIGFGGAFTDAVGINLKTVTKELQQQLLEQYFGKEGIGYTMSRVPISSTDFSMEAYSYLDKPNDFNLTTFRLHKADYDLKIPFIKQAEEILGTPLNLVASPWSAPAWMKSNGKMVNGGFLKGTCPGEYFETWGKYFIKFFDEYHKNGIDFWGLTTQNEPTSGLVPFYPFQSMYLSGEDQRQFVSTYLGPFLQASNYTKHLKVMINDDNVEKLPSYVEKAFDDPESSKYIHGVAIHWYHSEVSDMDRLQQTSEKYPEKFILSTEASTGVGLWDKGPLLGMWQRGVRYMRDIIDTMSRNTIGWIDWNLCLDLTGGPTFVDNRVDSAIIVDKEKGVFYKQPMFYALAHVSKFVPSHSYRIEHEVIDLPPEHDFRSIAFQTLDNKRVLIISNDNYFHTFDVQIKDPKSSKSIYYTIGPKSFTTIIWNKP
ncbi:unnamed protein product [Bursaphelenchus okinawaensis]|uniref:Glucosylceramidase n=1 Tax=Bursaphelenchus okinawaensis TaxID=465554 RepID=A0A811KXX8_9BILA|nr:unnamed protein product [Bursaphelenchus okinawaensis]CAG9114045.1 unnamed protein product [Bursaphelenchus okinawaensis]